MKFLQVLLIIYTKFSIRFPNIFSTFLQNFRRTSSDLSRNLTRTLSVIFYKTLQIKFLLKRSTNFCGKMVNRTNSRIGDESLQTHNFF